MDSRRRLGIGIIGVAMCGLLLMPTADIGESHTVASINQVVDTGAVMAPVDDQEDAVPLELSTVDPRRPQQEAVHSGRIAGLEAQVMVLEARVEDLETRIVVLSDFRDRAMAYQGRIEEWMANYKAWHARSYGGKLEPTPTLGIATTPDLGLSATYHEPGCVNGQCAPQSRRRVFRRRR